MATNSPRFALGRYDQGETGWDHTDLVNLVDEYAVERDTLANRPASGNYDGELYYATDEGTLYRWDTGTTSWLAESLGDIRSGTVGNIEAQSTAPSSPVQGDIWIDTS